MATSLAGATGAAAAPASGLSFAAVGGMLMALLMVLGLILAMAWVLRRMGGGTLGAPAGLATVATLPVGTRERVLVVQAGDTQLVIGVTAHQVTLLHRLDTPLPKPVAGDSFASLLARLRRGESA